jgi:hypothetical protein
MPFGPFSPVRVAVTTTLVADPPRRPITERTSMPKHTACDAASSASGVVPRPPSPHHEM